ncbi:hypothetical protein [Burkholderia multivorans]|uniref:hypothetical protein n=1 Tax=Burkholderia multivorans TaxID=87883 RepID=UPI0009C05F59|nr:hypothetical protein [Burkholderia multivorans]
MSTTQRKWLIALLLIGGGIATVAYTGYVKSYSDHEIKTTYFLKRYPTLQMEFYDPFANESDDVPIDQLAPPDRKHFSDYCKYRFGVTASTTQALEACKVTMGRAARHDADSN